MDFLDQGAIAPSFILRFLSGITNSSSIKYCVPSPSHLLQAPLGLLKEKSLGSISSIVKPDIGQA